jgi:hypothetical protein
MAHEHDEGTPTRTFGGFGHVYVCSCREQFSSDGCDTAAEARTEALEAWKLHLHDAA